MDEKRIEEVGFKPNRVIQMFREDFLISQNFIRHLAQVEKLNGNQIILFCGILDEIFNKRNSYITTEHLATVTNMNKSSVKPNVEKLVESGLLLKRVPNTVPRTVHYDAGAEFYRLLIAKMEGEPWPWEDKKDATE